jgi:hypothetical protein
MIESGLTTAAKVLFLKSVINDSCKLALYTAEAEIGPMTAAYTSEGEASGAGYTPGGIKLSNCCVETDTDGSAYITWDNAEWPKASITAAGYMVYDTSKNNASLFVGSWGADYTSTNGPFIVNIPEKQILLV